MSPLGLAFAVFVIGGVFAGIAQNRYTQALARKADSVSTNAEVMDEFLRRPGRVPQSSARETARRLRALVTAQSDPELESMRRQAIAADAVALAGFAAIAAIAFLK